jgi:hypothetical protein
VGSLGGPTAGQFISDQLAADDGAFGLLGLFAFAVGSEIDEPLLIGCDDARVFIPVRR